MPKIATPTKATQIRLLRERINSIPAGLAYDFARGVQGEARALAPVRTGHLKRSIKRTRHGHGDHEVVVGAFYGVYVNYGTRYMAAQPFWSQAVAHQRQILRGRMKSIVP